MAVEPTLLNPTTALISQKNTAETRYDHRRRTPINRVARDAVFSIPCQIKWNTNVLGADPKVTNVGKDEQEVGYILVRTLDITALGKEIKVDDRITEIGGIKMSLYITRLEYGSHYGGVFKLLKLHFMDRRGKEV